MATGQSAQRGLDGVFGVAELVSWAESGAGRHHLRGGQVPQLLAQLRRAGDDQGLDSLPRRSARYLVSLGDLIAQGIDNPRCPSCKSLPAIVTCHRCQEVSIRHDGIPREFAERHLVCTPCNEQLENEWTQRQPPVSAWSGADENWRAMVALKTEPPHIQLLEPGSRTPSTSCGTPATRWINDRPFRRRPRARGAALSSSAAATPRVRSAVDITRRGLRRRGASAFSGHATDVKKPEGCSRDRRRSERWED
jgi:hypothetical protein